LGGGGIKILLRVKKKGGDGNAVLDRFPVNGIDRANVVEELAVALA
jgi:hypothetical protein